MSRKIHKINFYMPKPRAVHNMALNNARKKLALSRNDASIEIWDINHVPCIEKLIPHDITNNSIEGLAWCNKQLFSISLEGFLVEYDLYALKYKKKVSVTGQAAYCIDVNSENTQISVGTEQGYINVFTVGEDVLFDKFMDKQEGKILCIKYHPNGEFLVSGSLDFIRVWNVQTGHAIHKMTTGRASTNKPTIVWCLSVTNDFSIVSGDSRGRLTFWDGNTGSQMESFQSHRADILAIALTDNENELHCVGVDPNIASYSRIQVKDDSYKWVKNVQRRVQDHDVRCLILNEKKRLISAGTDGHLYFVTLAKKQTETYAPILPNVASASRHSRLILLRYPRHLEVWRLGDADGNEEGLSPTEPKRLLLISSDSKRDGYEGREGILSSAISDNGNWLAYSTHSKTTLLNFSYDLTESTAKATRKWTTEEGAVALAFTPFTSQLLVAKRDGEMIVLSFAHDDNAKVVQTLTTPNFTETIARILVSPCGEYMIVTDSRLVTVWRSNAEGTDALWKFCATLPRYNALVTSMAIQPKLLNLIIAYNDHKLIEYDVREKRLTPFSKAIANQTIAFDELAPIRNVIFDPHETDKLIVHVGSKICVLDKNKVVTAKSKKMRKLSGNDEEGGREQKAINKEIVHRIIGRYDILAYFGNLSLDEYVAVEVPQLKLLEQLPPALKRVKFGNK